MPDDQNVGWSEYKRKVLGDIERLSNRFDNLDDKLTKNELSLGETRQEVRSFRDSLTQMGTHFQQLVESFDKEIRADFAPVKLLMYGFVGLVLVGFISALLMLVFKSGVIK